MEKEQAGSVLRKQLLRTPGHQSWTIRAGAGAFTEQPHTGHTLELRRLCTVRDGEEAKRRKQNTQSEANYFRPSGSKSRAIGTDRMDHRGAC